MSLDDILAEARTYIDELVPATGRVTMQPGRDDHRTLVHLPTLLTASGANRPVEKVFFAGGGAAIAVDVRATPAQWHWLIDGQDLVQTDFPGRDYDGTDPKTAPGHYASYQFEHTGPHQIAVRCGWTATASVRGLPGQQIAGEVAKTSAPIAVTVLQARAQLVYG